MNENPETPASGDAQNETCDCGSPDCIGATFESLTECVQTIGIRVIKGDDGAPFLHISDTMLALIAVARLNEKALERMGLPETAVQGASNVGKSIVMNFGGIVGDARRHVDMNEAVEVPDTIPDEWANENPETPS